MQPGGLADSTPQRRTALASVVAAAVLIAIKLVTGLAAGSLGLVADAAHSGTDLVAALLTFFAVGLATKPADAGHLYGHGKAEHLARSQRVDSILRRKDHRDQQDGGNHERSSGRLDQ